MGYVGCSAVAQLVLQTLAMDDQRSGIEQLAYECFRGVLEAVRCLLQAGVRTDQCPKRGWPRLSDQIPLRITASCSHREVVQLLSDAGADKEQTASKGETALIHATSIVHVELVRLLFVPSRLATGHPGPWALDLIRASD